MPERGVEISGRLWGSWYPSGGGAPTGADLWPGAYEHATVRTTKEFAVFDGSWRTGVDAAVQPVGRALVRAHVTPDFLTALGLVCSVATAVAIGAGQLRWGFVLLVASAVPDLLDGAVAKAGQSASPRGAFFDSVADRVTDSLVFGGIAWHLAETRDGQTHMIAVALLGASQLISYERAKAELYGWDAKGGLMERAERIIALCVALVFAPFLVPILIAMLVLTVATAVFRFVKVWRQAGRPPRPTQPPLPVRDRAPLGARWRELRAQAAARTASNAAGSSTNSSTLRSRRRR